MKKLPNRRSFLQGGALLAGMAATRLPARAADTPAVDTSDAHPKDLHAYGERSRFETSIRTGSLGTWPQPTSPPDYHKDFGFRTPLQDSVGFITPPALHYIVSHGYEPPDIDPREHRLLIHGMVNRPLIFSLEDLRRLPSVTRVHFVECNGNSAPTGPTGAIRRGADANAQDTHGLRMDSPPPPSETGSAFLVKDGPEFSILATNQMGDVCLATRPRSPKVECFFAPRIMWSRSAHDTCSSLPAVL